MSSTVTYAYLYRWTHLITNKWYIGCRTAKNCHPNDGYICSSKIVKPMVLENRHEWHREVLCIGEPAYIRALEARVLAHLDAASDPQSYNQYNNNLKFYTPPETKQRVCRELGRKLKSAEHKRKIGDARVGKKRKPFNEEWRANLAEAHRGQKRSDEFKGNHSAWKIEQNNNLWKITNPLGEVFFSRSLKAWCEEHFGDKAISAASNMRHKPYKGYTAEKVIPSSSC